MSQPLFLCAQSIARLTDLLTARAIDHPSARLPDCLLPCCCQVLPLVLELTQRVVDRMHACHQHQQLVDVTDGAKRITSDIMGHLLLGEDLGGTRWE